MLKHKINPEDGSLSYHYKNLIVIDPIMGSEYYSVQVNNRLKQETKILNQVFRTPNEGALKILIPGR